MSNDSSVSRRMVLGSGLAALSLATSKATSATALDPVRDLPMIYRKLRYSTVDEVVMWWFEGSKYGQQNAQFRPLYGVETCNWNRVKNLPGGGFAVTVLECAFYTDLRSGEVLREMINPYTKQRVTIPYAPVGPITATYDSRSNLIPFEELGGSRIKMKTTNGPVRIVGDIVWTQTSNDFQLVPKAGGATRQVNEWATYMASAKELADTSKVKVFPTVDLQEVTTWPRWLGMEGTPGSLMGRIHGRKVARFEDMPADFRRRLGEAFPEVARNPLAALDRAQAELVH